MNRGDEHVELFGRIDVLVIVRRQFGVRQAVLLRLWRRRGVRLRVQLRLISSA